MYIVWNAGEISSPAWITLWIHPSIRLCVHGPGDWGASLVAEPKSGLADPMIMLGWANPNNAIHHGRIQMSIVSHWVIRHMWLFHTSVFLSQCSTSGLASPAILCCSVILKWSQSDHVYYCVCQDKCTPQGATLLTTSILILIIVSNGLQSWSSHPPTMARNCTALIITHPPWWAITH